MMKRIILAIVFFGIISSCFCQEIYYEVRTDTGLFEDYELPLFKNAVQIQKGMIRMMKKGELVTYTFGGRYSLVGFEDDDPSYIVVTDQNGIKGKVALDDLFLPANDPLPDGIKNYVWISAYYYEILSGMKTLFECEPYWENEWYPSVGEELYEDVWPSHLRISDNAICISGYDNSLVNFLIISLECLPNCIKITAIPEIRLLFSKDMFFNSFKQIDTCTLIIKKDGDYLEMYLDDPEKPPLMIFSRTNDYEYKRIIKNLKAVARGEKADLDDVTWPRHADGTCDYEDEGGNATAGENANKEELADAPATERAESEEESAIPKPAPAVGKTADVTENLRLRTDDRTTAEVIATLAAGTRVKVEATGRGDTIDGIASNWVRVSVLGGARDRDGNAVAAGTEGWLFGGYLSAAEDAESENPRGETDAAKAPALPIVPIAAGVAVLAILLAAILLAAKKRKGGMKQK